MSRALQCGSMRKQQQIWADEHKTAQALPSEMSSTKQLEPSGLVVQFHNLLKKMGLLSGKVIDIGAGKGRNTFFMAEQGYEVFAMDYIPEAIAFISNETISRGLAENIHTSCHAMDQKWPFENNFFDIAIDSFASIDIETKLGREVYCRELYRTLRPGGIAMVSVVAAEDEMEAEMMKQSPGGEKNSSIWPQNGKFQKNYDEQELREFYSQFEILELQKINKKAHKLGRDFTATNYRLVLRKGE